MVGTIAKWFGGLEKAQSFLSAWVDRASLSVVSQDYRCSGMSYFMSIWDNIFLSYLFKTTVRHTWPITWMHDKAVKRRPIETTKN